MACELCRGQKVHQSESSRIVEGDDRPRRHVEDHVIVAIGVDRLWTTGIR
jgi:hypothetical protein